MRPVIGSVAGLVLVFGGMMAFEHTWYNEQGDPGQRAGRCLSVHVVPSPPGCGAVAPTNSTFVLCQCIGPSQGR